LLPSCSGDDPEEKIAFCITVHKNGTYSYGATQDTQRPGTLEGLRPHLATLESEGGALLIVPDGVYGGPVMAKLMDVLADYQIETFLQSP